MYLRSSKEANLRAYYFIGSKMFCRLVCLWKLRQLLLQVMTTTVKTVPVTTPAGVQQAARALTDFVQTGSELSSSAVVPYQIHTHFTSFDVLNKRKLLNSHDCDCET